MTATLNVPVTSSIRERAEAGADYLDYHLGNEWVLDINLTDLELADCGRCVLGQEFGNYYTGLDKLGIGYDQDAEHFGFTLPLDRDDDTWQELTAAWVEVISARLDAFPGVVE